MRDPFRRELAPAACEMPFVSTTSCLGWDRSFQEAYYFYVGRGTPQSRVCAAFLGHVQSTAASSRSCDFLDPSGWKEHPCRQFGLNEVSRCFACADGPDSGGTTFSAVQGLSADCTFAVGIRTGNVRPEAVMPFVRNPTGYPL